MKMRKKEIEEEEGEGDEDQEHQVVGFNQRENQQRTKRPRCLQWLW